MATTPWTLTHGLLILENVYFRVRTFFVFTVNSVTVFFFVQ